MLICNNLQALAPLATLVPQLANPCLGEGSPMIRIHNQPSDSLVFSVISYQPGEFCWVHLHFHLYQLWSPDSGYSSNMYVGDFTIKVASLLAQLQWKSLLSSCPGHDDIDLIQNLIHRHLIQKARHCHKRVALNVGGVRCVMTWPMTMILIGTTVSPIMKIMVNENSQ